MGDKETRKERVIGIELLRVVAMLMIVMLHYLSKGEVLPPLTEALTINGCVAWILECLSLVSVNAYMLISGYFLTCGRFRPSRLVGLWLQVLFYSLMVPVVLVALGLISPGDLDLYHLLQYLLPVEMIQYWFVTAYILMYLFSPILNAGVRAMSRRQLEWTLGLLLVFLSLNKSILPVRLEMDNLGYDGVWFVCVYLVAAYVRLYGNEPGEGLVGKCIRSLRDRGGVWYLASCLGLFGLLMAVHILYGATGALGTYFPVLLGYNHILNLLGALGLFWFFFKLRIPEGWLSSWIRRLASATFGVYLFHEQLELRFRWPGWLGASAEGNGLVFVARALACVLVVFGVGAVIDGLRRLVFRKIGARRWVQNQAVRMDAIGTKERE